MWRLKSFLKPPSDLYNSILSLNKDKFDSVNLSLQEEARYGMMNHLGSYLEASGIKSIVNYLLVYKTRYLYGSYSPINGDSFVWEVNSVNADIFKAYLNRLSNYNPKEYKIVGIDNAGFHSIKK